MKDQKFDVYRYRSVSLYGEIKDGCLHMESLVFGDEYDSEKIYDFSLRDTDKLFEYMTLEEFIEYGRKNLLIGLERLFRELNLHPDTFVW